ncbi:MAG: hypothetical protein NHG09_00075 [Candidatus Shikimatogenerans sp. JK-2022]|nr:hypothetical protein [Candidatus Shikimatogenerans bostrichidophilus]
MIKIGLNGFNRISKIIINNFFKNKKINLVVINLNNNNINIDNFIKILKYDTIYTKKKIFSIKKNKEEIKINNKYKIKIINEKNLKKVNWKKYKVKYIIETKKKIDPNIHIKQGASKVILTKKPKKKYPLLVIGENMDKINKKNNIYYFSSIYINCLIPILKILHREYKILECYGTFLEKSIIYRKKINNLIPFKNKIYKEIIQIIPDIKNLKFLNFLVPKINLSVLDLNLKFKKKTNYKKIKKIIKYNSKNEYSGILKYYNKTRYKKILYNKNICIFDSKLGFMINKNTVKIICRYNEIGYINKIIDIILYIEKNI